MKCLLVLLRAVAAFGVFGAVAVIGPAAAAGAVPAATSARTGFVLAVAPITADPSEPSDTDSPYDLSPRPVPYRSGHPTLPYHRSGHRAEPEPGPESDASADEEPSIVFTGSPMAPLVCTSNPDTESLTITDGMRITLANLTGADASVFTGTDQELSVADGLGVSVRFRPGRYALRMVPDCTMTGGIQAAVLTVTADAASGPDLPPDADPSAQPENESGPLVDPEPVVPNDPVEPGPATVTVPGDGPTASAPTVRPSVGPAATTGTATPSAPASVEAPPIPGTSAMRTPLPTTQPGSPTRVAAPDAHDPVIYDVVVVPWHESGADPRDAHLLVVIAVICVFGVTMAIIRAILTQRARRTLSM